MAKPVLKVKKDKNGKNCATVPCIEMLSYVYEKNLPLPDKSFNEIIKDLQEETKKVFAKTKPRPKDPTSNSFNNCNGRWAEYVFGAYVWNYLADKNATNKVSAKYSCGFTDPQVSPIIVVDRYLDYFTTIMEDRLWQVLAKPVFRWWNRSGLSMNAARAA